MNSLTWCYLVIKIWYFVSWFVVPQTILSYVCTGEPTCKADIWSIGCTVIEMATGSPPYFHLPPMSALFTIGSVEKPSPKLPDHFSDAAKDFVNKCLTKSMPRRPSAAEIGQHRFMLKEFIKIHKDNRGFYIWSAICNILYLTSWFDQNCSLCFLIHVSSSISSHRLCMATVHILWLLMLLLPYFITLLRF